MKRLSCRLAILAMVVGLGACDRMRSEAAVAEFKKAADAMCECKDKACAVKVNTELEKTMARYSDVKGTEAQKKELELVMKRFLECSQRAMGSGGEAPAGG